jgi:hypothetical protein
LKRLAKLTAPLLGGSRSGNLCKAWRLKFNSVLNLGIYKNFRLREDWKIGARGEAFNAFNHPRFGVPNTDPVSAIFEVVDPSQQNQQHVLQLAIKINF